MIQSLKNENNKYKSDQQWDSDEHEQNFDDDDDDNDQNQGDQFDNEFNEQNSNEVPGQSQKDIKNQLQKNHLSATQTTQISQDSLERQKQRAEERERQRNLIREGLYNDQELENERKNLWKEFGIDSAAGKELYNLYRCHKQPKINYPKPKPRRIEVEQKIIKQCPQKQQIEYPSLVKQPDKKFHMIDFVPRRKREDEIRKEIEKYHEGRKFFRPKIAGRDRKKLIEELQLKFKHLGGALPKGAELPQDEDTKSQAIKRTLRKDLHFTGLKPEQKDETETRISDDPLIELNMIFDQIINEIEERQQFLTDINNLAEPKLKQKIKDEIIERVAELQKITLLKKQFN